VNTPIVVEARGASAVESSALQPPAYAALELLALPQGTPVPDPCAADVWSCGVVLWELWFRGVQVPFDGLDASGVARLLASGARLPCSASERVVAAPALLKRQESAARLEQMVRLRRGSVTRDQHAVTGAHAGAHAEVSLNAIAGSEYPGESASSGGEGGNLDGSSTDDETKAMPAELKLILEACWHASPDARPEAAEALSALQATVLPAINARVAAQRRARGEPDEVTEPTAAASPSRALETPEAECARQLEAAGLGKYVKCLADLGFSDLDTMADQVRISKEHPRCALVMPCSQKERNEARAEKAKPRDRHACTLALVLTRAHQKKSRKVQLCILNIF
jgi:hypothetical protein